jgi:hypothetical protein
MQHESLPRPQKSHGTMSAAWVDWDSASRSTTRAYLGATLRYLLLYSVRVLDEVTSLVVQTRRAIDVQEAGGREIGDVVSEGRIHRVARITSRYSMSEKAVNI